MPRIPYLVTVETTRTVYVDSETELRYDRAADIETGSPADWDKLYDGLARAASQFAEDLCDNVTAVVRDVEMECEDLNQLNQRMEGTEQDDPLE